MTNDKQLDLALQLEFVLTKIEFTGEVDEGCNNSIRYIISSLRGETNSPYLEFLYSKGVH